MEVVSADSTCSVVACKGSAEVSIGSVEASKARLGLARVEVPYGT
jgi:hypothetical protein